MIPTPSPLDHTPAPFVGVSPVREAAPRPPRRMRMRNGVPVWYTLTSDSRAILCAEVEGRHAHVIVQREAEASRDAEEMTFVHVLTPAGRQTSCHACTQSEGLDLGLDAVLALASEVTS